MHTHTGKQFFPLDPRADDICIEDIAHALSIVNRFGGHSANPYSVAQHSVLVSRICPEEYALCGLLHDATEAYIGDVVTPLKVLLPEFKTIENNLWTVIAEKYDLPVEMPKEVKDADGIALATEFKSLMASKSPGPWALYHEPLKDYRVFPLHWAVAKDIFLARFKELTDGK